ncbi:iron complex transport system permease protein [Hydromonas duriensis]|uniref:Iron complex transport system permease protein n=2 Tax=Hydromonas duriensis TaxID=1527608 RepID=A0A4R6YAU6_9BURK|nr:iron complex transport system permease protein [Hydromonas duriensis]
MRPTDHSHHSNFIKPPPYARTGVVLFVSILIAISVIVLGLTAGALDLSEAVFWQLRLPRVLASFGVGGLLALAGLMLQVLLRNPLAEPYMLGAASGASFCVLLGMLMGGSWWLQQSLALFGALVALGLMLWVLRRYSRLEGDVTVLLLLGIVLSALLNALVSGVLLVLPDRNVRSALFWMMGDLAGAGSHYVAWCSVWLILALALGLARPMAVLMRGAVMAHSVGVDVTRLRWQLLLLAGLATAVAVMEAGAIGFVGLLVPHMVKSLGGRFFGANMRLILPLCVLWGGILLVLADVVARLLFAPTQLPVGLFTVLLGAPFLAWQLIIRARESGAV